MSAKHHKFRHARGFTLIELSIVMIIVGLMVVGAVNAYSIHMKQKQITTTSENLKVARNALQKFQDDNGFYPCPADPTDPLGRATNCAAPAPPGIKVVNVAPGKTVRIGVMPMFDRDGQTKLVSGYEAVDGWKNRLTYAVTESMAIAPELFISGNGAISIKDARTGTVTVTNGNIALLSHGEDGNGAYTANGVQVHTCPSGTKDAENCNDDAVFLSGDRSFAFGANYNDDYVDFSTATAVETTKACPEGSIMRGLKSNGDLICTNDMNCPADYALIGIMPDGVSPKCAVVSSSCGTGQVLVSLEMGGAPTCIRNMPGTCPTGYVQNGTNATVGDPNFGEPLCLQILTQCPSGYVQVGMQENHQPICVQNFNSQCPPNSVQVGNNTDGSANCRTTNCPVGQYFYGMSGGSPLCSGDRYTLDAGCPDNQFVKSIVNGVVTCAAPGNPSLGDPLYARMSKFYTDWNEYNAVLYNSLRTTYAQPSSFHGDTAVQESVVNSWYAACAVSASGQLPTYSDPVNYEYCGRFICAAETGIWPFMTRLVDQCPEGGSITCNDNHFAIVWACLNTSTR